jgi:2,3-bisphosphoglycerate-independent phosphoglycerate mutase
MIASDWENKIDVITKINEIYEFSIVVFPAYEETVVITADGTTPVPNPPSDETVPPETTVDEMKEEVSQALMSLIEIL